jgi:pilus assembly protein Flp/PilA
MKTILRCFIRDESGSTVIEYGLATALISIVIVGAVTLIGTALSGIYAAVGTALGAG